MIPQTMPAVKIASEIKESSLLGLLYKDLLQPSVKMVGAALGSVFEFSLLPISILQLGNDKIKANLKRNLTLYEGMLSKIPVEERIVVNPQIGVPILEKLAYTTNEEIALLFTNLLAKASSSKDVNIAHPVFIKIIESLSVDEAKIVSGLLKKPVILWVTQQVKTNAWGYLEDYLRLTILAKIHSLTFPENISLYMNNLVSLGVVGPPEGGHTLGEVDGEYQELVEYNGLKDWKVRHGWEYGEKENTRIFAGFYRATKLGITFANVCISQ